MGSISPFLWKTLSAGQIDPPQSSQAQKCPVRVRLISDVLHFFHLIYILSSQGRILSINIGRLSSNQNRVFCPLVYEALWSSSLLRKLVEAWDVHLRTFCVRHYRKLDSRPLNLMKYFLAPSFVFLLLCFYNYLFLELENLAGNVYYLFLYNVI